MYTPLTKEEELECHELANILIGKLKNKDDFLKEFAGEFGRVNNDYNNNLEKEDGTNI